MSSFLQLRRKIINNHMNIDLSLYKILYLLLPDNTFIIIIDCPYKRYQYLFLDMIL